MSVIDVLGDHLDVESFIRTKIEGENFTHQRLSDSLQKIFPGQKGFSIRSLQRYCASKDIHKTSRLNKNDLDEIVEESVNEVCIFMCNALYIV